MVTLPSLQDLHAHGVEVDKAAFAGAIKFHPRHIKNWNALRVSFPAFSKNLARRIDAALVFVANDCPSFRAKRKEMLQVLRGNFTPLIIKGQHYTSGRMSFWFTAPKDSVSKFKRSFNFDEAAIEEKQSLVEFYPFNKPQKARRPYQRHERPLSPQSRATADDIVRETAGRLEDDMLPVAISRLELDPHGPEAREMRAFVNDPKVTRDLLRRTRGKSKYARLVAVKRWVKEVFWPWLTNLLRDEASDIVDNVTRYAFKLTVALLVNEAVGKAREKEWGKESKFLQKWDYKPHMDHQVPVGAGMFTTTIRRNTQQEAEFQRQIKKELLHYYKSRTGDSVSTYFVDLLNIQFNPQNKNAPVSIHADKQKFMKAVAINPEALGKFAVHKEVRGKTVTALNDKWWEHFRTRVLPKMEKYANLYYQKGEDPEYSSYGW
jgi:hypothetical protein